MLFQEQKAGRTCNLRLNRYLRLKMVDKKSYEKCYLIVEHSIYVWYNTNCRGNGSFAETRTNSPEGQVVSHTAARS